MRNVFTAIKLQKARVTFFFQQRVNILHVNVNLKFEITAFDVSEIIKYLLLYQMFYVLFIYYIFNCSISTHFVKINKF